MERLDKIISAAESLEQKDLEALSSKILQMLKLSSGSNTYQEENQVHSCRRCSSSAILKYGKDKNGKQRYKCKNCNTIFYETSYSVVSKSRHSLSVWKRYIVLLLKGTSLIQCAKECNISVQTAFTWRHKILHALQLDQSDRMLGGAVEIDDLFFSISYKGNHKKSKNFTMPRKSYKRGTDNTAAAGGKACVLCAVERRGQTYAEVVGVGRVSVDELKYAFDNRLLGDSIAMTDKAPEFNLYFKDSSIELVSLRSRANRYRSFSPPEVKGSFHIQNVNNLHSRIRKTMKRYNGVATKYLNHYISLFIWIENYKKIDEYNMQKYMLETICENNSYVSYNDIVKLPPVPHVA